MEDRPYPTIKRITKDMDADDVVNGRCARCGMRIGTHSLRESWKHGLMTKAQYVKHYEDETNRLESVKK